MLLQYCSEIGCISEYEAEALHQSFLELISDLVLEQQTRVEQGKLINQPTQKVDYLSYIRKLYREGRFRLAPSAKKFDEMRHDGVIHRGYLYLYGDNFRNIITAVNANIDEVLDDIESQGALLRVNGKRNVQLFISKGKTRRCYVFQLTHLN